MIQTLTRQLSFRQHILADPKWYCNEVLGQDPWEKQVEIINSVLHNQRTAVSGCVGSTKTYGGALAALAFFHAYPPSEIYMIAPTYRQVNKLIWKYIRKIKRNSILELGGNLPTETPHWRIAEDYFMQGMSPKDPDALQGEHAKNTLIIVDEAQGVPQPIIEAAENALTGANCRLLLLFNPNAEKGDEAYECAHSKRHLYHNITIDADNVPNVIHGDERLPGAMTRKFRDDMIETYGWDSNIVRVKVRALYPKQDDDALIPIEWIEKAVHRQARELEADGKTTKVVLGVDPAGQGGDEAAIAPMHGMQVKSLIIIPKCDGPELAGKIRKEIDDRGAMKTFIDNIGSDVDAFLRKDGVAGVRGINVGRRAKNPDKFINVRAESFWGLREAFDPKGDDPIGIPNDLKLIGEASTIKYGSNRQGKTFIELKADLKKRLKRSPDRLDAVNLARLASASAVRVARGGTNKNSARIEKKTLTGRKRTGSFKGSGGRLSERFGIRRTGL